MANEIENNYKNQKYIFLHMDTVYSKKTDSLENAIKNNSLNVLLCILAIICVIIEYSESC